MAAGIGLHSWAHSNFEPYLEKLEKLLPPTYRLTLLARNTESETAHIVLTRDKHEDIIRALTSLENDPATTEDGPGARAEKNPQ